MIMLWFLKGLVHAFLLDWDVVYITEPGWKG